MEHAAETKKKRVCVCVLGDIGHSPRMQYHSMSLAKHGFDVDVVAYLGIISTFSPNINLNLTIHFFLHFNMPSFILYSIKSLCPMNR